jgi:hypothetical protein
MRMTNPNFVIASLKCYLTDGGAVAAKHGDYASAIPHARTHC